MQDEPKKLVVNSRKDDKCKIEGNGKLKSIIKQMRSRENRK